ncbi:hypothetical protein D3C76_36940 [compost metagenome]
MKMAHGSVQHRQRLEITLDIFRGCGHSCSGCMIDKQLGGDVDDIPQLAAMIKEMVQAGYVAFDMGIGPTDYMSSDNVQDVMSNPVFQEMAQWFHQITFNAAFLEKDMEKYKVMCEEIDEACPGKAIRFLMPAAPNFFKSDKFGKMIVEKLEYVKKHLQIAYLNEAGFVVNCTHETVGDDFDQMMENGFAVDFPVDKDDILNIPYGRLKVKDLMAGQNIKRMSHRISQFYSGLSGEDERRRNPDLCYHTGTMVNLLYTGGKLYWVPFLKDDCPFLEDDFVVPRPWTMENLLTTRQKALERAVAYLADTPCMSCVYMSSCSEKGIVNIMERMQIKDCLVGLQYVGTDSKPGV